jgi:holo-[acyl-carrier protein] synthase
VYFLSQGNALPSNDGAAGGAGAAGRPAPCEVEVELLGIGTDLCEVDRMARELAREGGGFRDTVFTAAEIACCAASAHPSERFAARFAAKEAVFKALVPAGVPTLVWQEIEIVVGEHGEPLVRLHGATGRVAEERGVGTVRVSLSHAPGMAAAFAVAVARG